MDAENDNSSEDMGGDIDDEVLRDENQVYASLANLCWVHIHLQVPFQQALHTVITAAVTDLVAGNFEEEGILDRVLRWNYDVLVP